MSEKVLNKCPGCNSNIPVAEKICRYCGYEFLENIDETLTQDNLLKKIETNFF